MHHPFTFRPNRNVIAALLIAAGLGVVSATSLAVTDTKPRGDQAITNAVEHILMTDSALRGDRLDATTSQGIVTLSGTANHLLARDRATRLAQTIRGVRGVVNTIKLETAAVPDEELRKNVESALLYDAATDAWELSPRVKDGIVTLEGTVQSYPEKQLATHVAKSVKGVKEVKNNIIMKGKADRADAEIAAEVKRLIATDVWLNPNFITTEVKDGVVTLAGAVGSSAQHGRATLLAATPGVKEVNVDGLKIEPWAKDPAQRNTTIAIKGDPQIKKAVMDAFVYDPRVFSFNPQVDVTNGVVTLTGVVDNLRAKRAAEQDAKNTLGVWHVKNFLKVRPAQPLSDDQVTQNIEAAFVRDPVVDSYQIQATTKGGVVTLTGRVDSYFEKAAAEDLASRANGVTAVRNNLLVSYSASIYYGLGHDPAWTYPPYYSHRPPFHSTWPYTSDAEVKDDIEDEMFWSPFVDFDDIAVKVENGVATLTGTAESWFEFNKATENAYEGGARQVYNQIRVN